MKHDNHLKISGTKRSAVIAISVFSLIAAILFLSHGFSPTNNSSAKEPVQTTVMDASWPSYPTMKELVGNSTDVVLGHVQKISAIHDESIPLTDFSFSVDKVAKGNLTPGDVITIRQTGIETSQKVAIMKEDPLLTAGESFVGFLRYSPDHGVYVIIGGPQGRFIERDGSVSSLDVSNPVEDNFLPIKMKDVSVAQLFTQVSKEAGSQ